MSAADSCPALTPSARAAAANAGDAVSAWPAANSGRSAALTRAALTCSSSATAATIASWPCRSSAALEPPGALFLAPSGACVACWPAARLCLACMSAADSCPALTPSARAAAANAGDAVSAWPAANSGRSAALTRAALACGQALLGVHERGGQLPGADAERTGGRRERRRCGVGVARREQRPERRADPGRADVQLLGHRRHHRVVARLLAGGHGLC